MIKRLFFIALLLGLGQLVVIFSLKNISQTVSSEYFSLFGQTESNFQFLIILIAAGLLSDAVRKIAQTNNWQQEYLNYQSARFFLSLLLIPVTLFFFVDKSYVIFLIAPVIGLSGEYAFYGTGKPVIGAVIAFIRIIIPYGLSIVCASLLPQFFTEIFVLLLFITYFITGLLIAKLLDVRYFVMPSAKAFRLYFTSLKLGIINILFYMQGLGLMLLIPLLFTDNFQVISIAFIGLKFYAIYKSIIRIIHQAFIREMVNIKECLTVDKLSMILGFTFLAAIFIFPNTTITLLFGPAFTNAALFFQILAISCLIFSFCIGMSTNAVLMHFESKLLRACILSFAVCTGSLLIFTYLLSALHAICAALLLGEIVLSAGIAIMYYKQNILKERFLFLFHHAIPLGLPLLLKMIFFSDSLIGLFVSVGCYGTLLLLLNLKEFNTVRLTQPEH